jgi:hypothetical protein
MCTYQIMLERTVCLFVVTVWAFRVGCIIAFRLDCFLFCYWSKLYRWRGGVDIPGFKRALLVHDQRKKTGRRADLAMMAEMKD